MATMIPPAMRDDNGSYGERQVFKKLREELPPDYTVFHSLWWNDWNENEVLYWGEADFAVFHPKMGMLAIEVKSGGIECHNNEWNYIRTDNGKKYEMQNPLRQANKSKHYLEKEIKKYLSSHGIEEQYCWVSSAVWFPSINERDVVGELPEEFRPEITLYERDLEDPTAAIEGVFRFYKSQMRTLLKPETAQAIVSMLAPRFSAIPSLSVRRREKEDAFHRVTQEQRMLLDYLEEQDVALIQGAAGTGKTMIAVEKARRLSDDSRALLLCYNKHLKNHLIERKKSDPQTFQNIDIDNLAGLASDRLGQSKVDKGDILRVLGDPERYECNYKHIVVDESQDFSTEQMEKLHEIAVLNDGSLYAFYDKNQYVQGENYFSPSDNDDDDDEPKWLKLMECRLVLHLNCRNTFAIAETSGKAVGIKPKMRERAVQGDMPSFYVCKTERDLKKRLSVLIDRFRREGGYSYDSICILTMKAEEDSLLYGVDKLGNHKVCTTRTNSGVFFTSARRFKGLESDVVVIIDVDKNSLIEDGEKRLFYVAASRAKHFLNIVFSGDEDEACEMSARLADRRFPKLAATVAVALKARLETG